MWRILQMDEPEDFVIATGKSTSLEVFVELAFAEFDLDWQAHVEIKMDLLRPSDLMQSYANPDRAREKLGWKAMNSVEDVVRLMVEGNL